ncbi:MAG: hypothetical protein ACXV39_12485, partial [Halobacteriota archaeon]
SHLSTLITVSITRRSKSELLIIEPAENPTETVIITHYATGVRDARAISTRRALFDITTRT